MWGWIGHNPARLATAPSVGKADVQPPQAEDAARLLSAAMAGDLELGLFLRLAVMLGARRGELCALRWPDIDRDRGEVLITGNVVRVPKQALVHKDTKTHAKRRVAVGAGTVEQLRARQVAQASPEVHELVKLAQAAGWEVCVIATPEAMNWIDPAMLAELTGYDVRTSTARQPRPSHFRSPTRSRWRRRPSTPSTSSGPGSPTTWPSVCCASACVLASPSCWRPTSRPSLLSILASRLASASWPPGVSRAGTGPPAARGQDCTLGSHP